MTFPIPRPKAAEAPAKLPRRTNKSAAPMQGSLRDLHRNKGEDREAEKTAAIEREIEHALRDSRVGRVTRRRNAAEKARNATGYNGTV